MHVHLHNLRQMADNSFAWAKERNLLRTNPVHKMEEAKLVLEESFSLENETGESRELSGHAEVEAQTMNTSCSTHVSLCLTL